MGATSITVDSMFQLKVLIINKSKDTHDKFQELHTFDCKVLLDFILCFWSIFVDFQNEATGLCVNNSIKDV